MRVYEYIKLFNALQWFTIRKFIHYKMCMFSTLLNSLNILHGTMRFKFKFSIFIAASLCNFYKRWISVVDVNDESNLPMFFEMEG